MVQLKRFARKVALGEKFEPVVDESTDEIGQLNRDIQSMLVSLQDAEEERTESLIRLEAILDSVQAGVVIIDPEGRTMEEVHGNICHGFICPAATDSCPVLDLNQQVGGEIEAWQKEMAEDEIWEHHDA